MLEGEIIEQVEKYPYLGTTVNDNWEHSVEVHCRIEKEEGRVDGRRGPGRRRNSWLKT